ncbi:MAG: hypothetical protein ACOYOV_05265 [Bacteroidales bacterium]
MKKANRSFFLIVTMVAYVFVVNAQQNIDFETVGSDWKWTIFGNGTDAKTLYAVVANPLTTGINSSAMAAKYIINSDAETWAGIWSDNIGEFTISETNCKIKIMVKKDVLSDFNLKLENPTAIPAFAIETKVSNKKINEWEELTFDLSKQIGKTFKIITLIPDQPANRTVGSTVYIDNITFNSGSLPAEQVPTIGAPTPTIGAINATSLFSNAFINVGVDTWRTTWSSGSDLTDLKIAGDDTKKYANFDYFGIETIGANMLNLSDKNYLHLDVWTVDVASLRIKLVDIGDNAVFDGVGKGDDVEHELTFKPELLNWNSLNIPISDFTGLYTKAHISQIIFAGTTGGTLYLDNLYFSSISTGFGKISDTKAILCYPNPVSEKLNIASASEINEVRLSNLLGQNLKNII